jgi:hypothetical protein
MHSGHIWMQSQLKLVNGLLFFTNSYTRKQYACVQHEKLHIVPERNKLWQKRNILHWQIWIRIRIRIKMQRFRDNNIFHFFNRIFLEEKRNVYDVTFPSVWVCFHFFNFGPVNRIRIARESDTMKDNSIIAIDFVRFEVMTAVAIKITSFWEDTNPHSLIKLLQRFGEAYWQHIYVWLLLYT